MEKKKKKEKKHGCTKRNRIHGEREGGGERARGGEGRVEVCGMMK